MWEYLNLLRGLWFYMLAGAALILSATVCGWFAGRNTSFALTRSIRWWLIDVMLALIRRRSWIGRTVTIFVNNITILSGIVLLGYVNLSLVATALVGFAMGVALRVLGNSPDAFFAPPSGDGGPEAARRVGKVRLGIAFNLLEPPAIIAAIGLGWGVQEHADVSERAWPLFMICIVPPMLLAAGGEALWIGECLPRSDVMGNNRNSATRNV